MLEVVDLFREQGTVDELGIGSIRDALSDMLFPGTSVLHTRLRYVLFVPWLLQLAGERKRAPAEMDSEFRSMEYRLITALMNGGERAGVFGRQVGDRLKNLPSSAYWSALGAWGLVDADSPAAYFRRLNDLRALERRTLTTDDPEVRGLMPNAGVDPELPGTPEGLMKSAHFALSPDEEHYLSDRITVATAGSALAWLIENQPRELPDHQVWELESLSEAPPVLQKTVDHARRFSIAIHGAAILYNLLLAETADNEALADRYRVLLRGWGQEVALTRVLEHWERADWWSIIQRQNPRLSPLTRTFVDRWIDLIRDDTNVAESADARQLVSRRERQIKGGRARLVNRAALDSWTGDSGMGRLGYRWTTARSHLQDLYTARAL